MGIHGIVKRIVGLIAMTVSASTALAQAQPSEAARIFAPTGTLRAAINFGNPVLAQRDPATGEPRGVSVALARAFAEKLGVGISFVGFDEAGKVVEAVKEERWDIAFLAVDPVRAAGIDFTPPYVLIEGAYLVPAGGRFVKADDVDQEGVRIAVATGSAYDLFLTRNLKKAKLERFANGAAANAAMLEKKVDVLAGVRQPLDALARQHSDVLVLPERFMAIEQAMAVPKGREGALPVLSSFVEEAKASGLVTQGLRDSGQSLDLVAPPQPIR